MIYGASNWSVVSIRYLQTTKIVERFLADLKKSRQADFWLESCNVCSAACAVEAVGADWKATLPMIDGSFVITQADLMFDWIYSDGSGMYEVDGVCENEVPENLRVAIEHLSNAHAALKTYEEPGVAMEDMKASLRKGKACVLSYRTDYGSGHYICAVAYDTEKHIFLCYDSWPQNKHCKRNGILEEYGDEFFSGRMRPRYIEVGA